MVSLIVLYSADISFDREYYLNTHVPLVRQAMTPLGMQACEVDELLPGLDGSPPPYQVVFRMHFESLDVLQAALAKAGADVMADIPNYYAGQPDMLVGNRVTQG